jgi:hypothetical protein
VGQASAVVTAEKISSTAIMTVFILHFLLKSEFRNATDAAEFCACQHL